MSEEKEAKVEQPKTDEAKKEEPKKEETKKEEPKKEEAKKEEPKAEEPKEEKVKPELKVTKNVEKALKAALDLSVDERKAFIAEYVGGLSVLELNDQVKTLEDHFDVSASPAGIMMAAMPGMGGAEAAEEEKSTFDVILKEIGPKKIQVIKAVRAITSLGLKEAKALVDGAPGPIKEDLSQEEAEKIKEELEQAGAVVELK